MYCCVYIYIRQLSSFRVPALWFIDLTVATNMIYIQLHFSEFVWLFYKKMDKTQKYLSPPLSYDMKIAADGH